MQEKGLYRPQFDHDACGIGFIARTTGKQDHDIVAMALEAISRMQHRGGVDADGHGRNEEGAGGNQSRDGLRLAMAEAVLAIGRHRRHLDPDQDDERGDQVEPGIGQRGEHRYRPGRPGGIALEREQEGGGGDAGISGAGGQRRAVVGRFAHG